MLNDHFTYFIDHLPSIITAICSGIIMVRQHVNAGKVKVTADITQSIKHDMDNGVIPNRVALAVTTATVDQLKPVIEKNAKIVVDTARQVAADLADATGTFRKP